MKDLVKRYLPYAIVIFAVFLIVPLIFANDALKNYSAIAFYFILLVTTVACSAIYCSKHGLDFLFALISPIAFLFTMTYCGGFKLTNIVLIFVYLVAGIFGLFLGDLAFGDERRKREQKEKREAEEVMLQANRRDASERQRIKNDSRKKEAKPAARRAPAKAEPKPQPAKSRVVDDDDFDYDKYLADIDRKSPEEAEIDQILNDWHS